MYVLPSYREADLTSPVLSKTPEHEVPIKPSTNLFVENQNENISRKSPHQVLNN